MAEPSPIYQRLRRRLMGEAGQAPEPAERAESGPHYPELPEDAAPASEVGRLYQEWLCALDDVYPRAAQVRLWEQEREGHEATVRDARPGCDYGAVAAALAAIQVLTRHIDPLRQAVERDRDEIGRAKAAYERAWARYRTARSRLAEQDLRPEEREALREEIARLVGDVSAGE